MTDIGITGGGKGNNMLYLSGVQKEKILTDNIKITLVHEVEKKVYEIEKINKMIPQKTIQELINKHSILEKDLSTGKLDKKMFAEKSKEYSDINEIIDVKKTHLF